MTKTFRSFQEFQTTCFPNKILDRLEERIRSSFRLTENQSHLTKSEQNPKIGFLRMIRPIATPYQTLNALVDSFYQKEGFETIQSPGGRTIEVKKESENYWITITESQETYAIHVYESPISFLNFPNQQKNL